MEAVFLACFLFGAVFALASVALGALGAGHQDLPAGHVGHAEGFGAGGPHGHDGGGLAAVAGSTHGGTAGAPAAHAESAHAAGASGARAGLPLLNLSSCLAFLTWFGATGYLLTVFGGWPVWAALPAAVVVGLAGAMVIAYFLVKVRSGEREMDPREYRLAGTIARVTVSIPAAGTGEVVFSKGGVRRGEAARHPAGQPIPRDTEVVILDYERGVALVQPWDELVARRPIDNAGPGEVPPAGDLGRESHA